MCRNPDDGKGPWCWVDVERDRFGYCSVSKCESSSTTATVSINKGSNIAMVNFLSYNHFSPSQKFIFLSFASKLIMLYYLYCFLYLKHQIAILGMVSYIEVVYQKQLQDPPAKDGPNQLVSMTSLILERYKQKVIKDQNNIVMMQKYFRKWSLWSIMS